MKCEKCNKEHNGSYGSGRFCSESCARSHPVGFVKKKVKEKKKKYSLTEQTKEKLKKYQSKKNGYQNG